jgi:serine protease Do
MHKSILISVLLSASLLAGNITFENAPTNPKHRLPNGENEILSFHDILKNSMDAVVNISTKTIVKNQGGYNRLFNDPFFQEFFGQRGLRQPNQQPSTKRDNALGSGVIVSKDGYIVTNNHVLDDADEITVTINHSDKEYLAKVIGKDKDSDLAVIKIEANNLKPIALSHANEIKLGDVVFAIGNPFGVGQTVTQGIVSALNKDHVGINKYENFIQTDASINPGNSGGALIDSRGALIGINSAILSQTGGNHGIGFTIPVDMVRNVVSKLIKDGKVSRGFIGVNISKVTSDLKSLYEHKKGAIITDVQPNSPAQKAQLQRGDLIYAVNDIPVKGPHDLQERITAFNPNDTITLSIERDKQNLTKTLSLSSTEGSINTLGQNQIELEGLYLSELTPTLKQTYQIPSNITGLFIEKVVEKSQSEANGFLTGDILIQIENRRIETFNDAQKAFADYKGQTKRVYVNRQGYILLLVTR